MTSPKEAKGTINDFTYGRHRGKETNNLKQNNSINHGQNHGFARAIEISSFFLDLILVEASEMNNTVGFIFISASKRFCSSLCVFNI